MPVERGACRIEIVYWNQCVALVDGNKGGLAIDATVAAGVQKRGGGYQLPRFLHRLQSAKAHPITRHPVEPEIGGAARRAYARQFIRHTDK